MTLSDWLKNIREMGLTDVVSPVDLILALGEVAEAVKGFIAAENEGLEDDDLEAFSRESRSALSRLDAILAKESK